MSRIIGTYTYPSYANKEKIQKIKQILTEYRKTAKNIAKLQWNYFFKNNTFNKNLDIKNTKIKTLRKIQTNMPMASSQHIRKFYTKCKKRI